MRSVQEQHFSSTVVRHQLKLPLKAKTSMKAAQSRSQHNRARPNRRPCDFGASIGHLPPDSHFVQTSVLPRLHDPVWTCLPSKNASASSACQASPRLPKKDRSRQSCKQWSEEGIVEHRSNPRAASTEC